MECITHQDCPGDQYCELDTLCKQKKDNGSLTHNPKETSCLDGRYCKSGICEDLFCRICNDKGGCAGDEYCDTYYDCQKKKVNSEYCWKNNECQSVSKIE